MKARRLGSNFKPIKPPCANHDQLRTTSVLPLMDSRRTVSREESSSRLPGAAPAPELAKPVHHLPRTPSVSVRTYGPSADHRRAGHRTGLRLHLLGPLDPRYDLCPLQLEEYHHKLSGYAVSHRDLGSRKGERFSCLNCGAVMDADLNGALNIAAVGGIVACPEYTTQLSCPLSAEAAG